jgi:hypothetical protein
MALFHYSHGTMGLIVLPRPLYLCKMIWRPARSGRCVILWRHYLTHLDSLVKYD